MTSVERRHRSDGAVEERSAQGADVPHRARERVRVGPALVRADVGRRVLPLQLPGPGRRPLRLPRRVPGVRQLLGRPRRRRARSRTSRRSCSRTRSRRSAASSGRRASSELALPETIGELDRVWKDWTIALRDEQMGKLKADQPYLHWARCARDRRRLGDGAGALREGPRRDARRRRPARSSSPTSWPSRRTPTARRSSCSKALRVLESKTPVDEKRVRELDQQLARLDPKRDDARRACTTSSARPRVRWSSATRPPSSR